jgi:hypothetical protein
MIISKEFTVTGLSKHSFDRFKDRISLGSEFILKPDPTNTYDPNATGVFIKYLTLGGIEDIQIGWIPKADNAELSRILNGGYANKISATVVKFETAEPLWKSRVVINVKCDLKPEIDPSYALSKGFIVSKYNQEYEAYFSNTTVGPNVYISSSTTIPYNTSADRYDHTADALRYSNPCKEINLEPNKETKMQQIINTNQSMAKQAAYQEAGRVLLSQLTKFVVKQSPMFVKGYVDTPFGKLALANAVVLAVQQFRPNDVRLKQLANAALAQAYQEVYKSFDIDGFINQFLEGDTLKGLLNERSDSQE